MRHPRPAWLQILPLLMCAWVGPEPARALSLADIDLGFEIRMGIPGSGGQQSVYQCFACTLADWEQVVVSGGTIKNQPGWAQPILDEANAPVTPPPGIPAALDFTPTIPGGENIYVARVLGTSAFGEAGRGYIRARVQRTNTFVFPAGQVIHELTDPDGALWVLLTIPLSETVLDPRGLGIVDPTALGALAHVLLPRGWRYESRVLSEDFEHTNEDGVVDILAPLQPAAGAWQRVTVPEPTVALVLLALAASRHRRQRCGISR